MLQPARLVPAAMQEAAVGGGAGDRQRGQPILAAAALVDGLERSHEQPVLGDQLV
jgi:hypothetical protein